MKVYQCIHKYPPHIPLFEKRYGITDESDITFAQLQRLVLEDGYASAYVLLPAIEGRNDEVFFTIWNYERLQLLWAKENGLKTASLTEIKKAQIDFFKPDVFYDFSAFLDHNFVAEHLMGSQIKKICWYGIIQEYPELFKDYDLRVTLHRPYVDQWSRENLKSFELQPAFDSRWEKYNISEKPIDILFYGQYYEAMFSKRNRLIDKLIELKKASEYNIKIHLQYPIYRKPYINIPFLRRYGRIAYPNIDVVNYSDYPIYGHELYQTIGQSKFVINAYTNFNLDFKSNMRLFESIGCGSLLISEKGNYPEGFVWNKNYISYSSDEELISMLPAVIKNYQNVLDESKPYIDNVIGKYSKQNQWEQFKGVVSKLL